MSMMHSARPQGQRIDVHCAGSYERKTKGYWLSDRERIEIPRRYSKQSRKAFRRYSRRAKVSDKIGVIENLLNKVDTY